MVCRQGGWNVGWAVVIAAAMGWSGCGSDGGSGGGGGAGSDGGEDTGGTDEGEESGEEPDVGGSAECDPPPGEPGTGTGDLFDAAAVLTDCDGNPVRLADVMCGAKLTLVDIGAGWCQPCIEAAGKLEEELVEPFGDKGLQVISVLFQDEQGSPATTAFCKQWRDQFGLTTPVLIDPLFKLEPYFEDNQQAAPVSLLVDADNVIVHVEAGIPPTDLDDTIAAELEK